MHSQINSIKKGFSMDEIKLHPKDYDGIYFTPGKNSSELVIRCWEFQANTEYAGSKPIEGNQIGNMYHIALFREDNDGHPMFDDKYEAILGDPETYVKNLTGAGLYGCILKKTEKSSKWFEEYFKSIMEHITSIKQNTYSESIANT